MTQDYIRLLRQHLKNFPQEEREALIAEITSHMESGEDDPRMGKSKEERQEKMLKELGSPKDMSSGFKTVYRSDRWIDYLLIAMPYLLYPLLNTMYVSLMPKYSWADVRLDILIHLPLVVIALWRKSAPLALFWLTTIVTQIVAMLLITQGYYGAFQTLIWLIIALGLLALLGHLVWQNRQDALITVFGLLPILMCGVGSMLAIIHPSAAPPYSFGSIDRLLLNVYANLAGFGGGYLPFYGTLASMAIFFLAIDRNVRWFGLGLYGLVIALSRNYLNVFDADQGTMHPLTYSFYVVVPLIIVFLGWWLNHSKTQLKIAE